MILLFSQLLIISCRGWRSEKPPIHPNPNMDWQAKFKAQTLSLTPPEHTIPWGNAASFMNQHSNREYLNESSIQTGKDESGALINKIPINVDEILINRGRERYNIYCSVCHDYLGEGQGPVVKRGFVLPPSFYTSRVIEMSDGYLFDVISNGIRHMPAYKKQITIHDRWAIVSYIRALQKTRSGKLSDIPVADRKNLK